MLRPGPHDDVLDPAGDVDIAAGDVSEITAVQPVAIEQFAGFLRVADVTAHGRRSTPLQASFLALASATVIRTAAWALSRMPA